MAATAQALFTDDIDLDIELDPTPPGEVDSTREELHWERAFQRESYYRAGYDFEDYAPAYCVGYVGQSQYGGGFDDAVTSLCANWVRIKGDSRLSLEDAMPAIRAAWERAERISSTPKSLRRLYAVPRASSQDWLQAANQPIR